MFATIRTYAGGAALAEALAERASDVESLISTVPGFRAYHLVRGADATVTITVCEDAAGCAESTRRAAEFLREHAGELPTSVAPQVTTGDVLISLGAPAIV